MTTREKVEAIVRQEGRCRGFSCESNTLDACPFWTFDCTVSHSELFVAARKWLAAHPKESSIEPDTMERLQQIARGSCKGWDCIQCPLHEWHSGKTCGAHDGNISNPSTIAEAKRRIAEIMIAQKRETGEPREDSRCPANLMSDTIVRAPDAQEVMRGFRGAFMPSIFPALNPHSSLVDQRRAIRRRLLGL